MGIFICALLLRKQKRKTTVNYVRNIMLCLLPIITD